MRHNRWYKWEIFRNSIIYNKSCDNFPQVIKFLRVQDTMVKGTASIATPSGGDSNTVETITFTADTDKNV